MVDDKNISNVKKYLGAIRARISCLQSADEDDAFMREEKVGRRLRIYPDLTATKIKRFDPDKKEKFASVREIWRKANKKKPNMDWVRSKLGLGYQPTKPTINAIWYPKGKNSKDVVKTQEASIPKKKRQAPLPPTNHPRTPARCPKTPARCVIQTKHLVSSRLESESTWHPINYYDDVSSIGTMTPESDFEEMSLPEYSDPTQEPDRAVSDSPRPDSSHNSWDTPEGKASKTSKASKDGKASRTSINTIMSKPGSANYINLDGSLSSGSNWDSSDSEDECYEARLQEKVNQGRVNKITALKNLANGGRRVFRRPGLMPHRNPASTNLGQEHDIDVMLFGKDYVVDMINKNEPIFPVNIPINIPTKVASFSDMEDEDGSPEVVIAVEELDALEEELANIPSPTAEEETAERARLLALQNQVDELIKEVYG